MGGCYTDYSPSVCSRPAFTEWEGELRKFVKKPDLESLVSAYKAYFTDGNKKGFIAELAKAKGINDVADIPKEFNGIEYEVKFDIVPNGRGKEPGVEAYLDAFDFPVGANTKVARYLKDPINNVATGVNHFYGDSMDEKVVVIEKMGKTYLKEKGLVSPISYGIPGEQLVIKRTEDRYEAGIENIISKVNDTLSVPGNEYRGKIRKEKGDAFVLDALDGRIYSMSFTRAHLIRAGESIESDIQRQMEFEYAGYIPGFGGFKKDSEPEIIKGMVELAKQVYRLYGMGSDAVLANSWTMRVEPTFQRKYDFIIGNPGQGYIDVTESIQVPLPLLDRGSNGG